MSKNVVIVGGSSGIGQQCVSSLAAQDFKIYTVSRAPEKSQDSQIFQHFSVDVLSNQLDRMQLPEVIDALIYCPGSIRLKPFKSVSIQEFEEDFALNCLGFIRVLQESIDKLKKSKNASVVVFSTVAVSQGMAYHSSVATAKGALEGLVRSLAAEYAHSNIRFNAIAPSLVDTPLSSKILQSIERRETISNRHPLRKIGDPKDVASLVKYLVNADSSWMTGQVIGLDGGISAIKNLAS